MLHLFLVFKSQLFFESQVWRLVKKARPGFQDEFIEDLYLRRKQAVESDRPQVFTDVF